MLSENNSHRIEARTTSQVCPPARVREAAAQVQAYIIAALRSVTDSCFQDLFFIETMKAFRNSVRDCTHPC